MLLWFVSSSPVQSSSVAKFTNPEPDLVFSNLPEPWTELPEPVRKFQSESWEWWGCPFRTKEH